MSARTSPHSLPHKCVRVGVGANSQVTWARFRPHPNLPPQAGEGVLDALPHLRGRASSTRRWRSAPDSLGVAPFAGRDACCCVSCRPGLTHRLPQSGDKSLTCRSCPGRETMPRHATRKRVISSLTCPRARVGAACMSRRDVILLTVSSHPRAAGSKDTERRDQGASPTPGFH